MSTEKRMSVPGTARTPPPVAFINSRRWALLRQRVRAEEPLCQSCLTKDGRRRRRRFDHIIPPNLPGVGISVKGRRLLRFRMDWRSEDIGKIRFLLRDDVVNLSTSFNLRCLSRYIACMTLRAYCDGSRTDGVSSTLACVAASDELWKEFDADWRFILRERGNAPYLHMKEAMPLTGPFADWDEANRDALVQGCRDLLVIYSARPQFRIFTCVVDLAAHSRWAKEKHMSSPEALSVWIVFQQMMGWYSGFKEPLVEPLDLYFDRGERYLRYIHNRWQKKTLHKEQPMWRFIRTLEPLDMPKHTPLQCADLIAWSRNRLSSTPADSPLALKPDVAIAGEWAANANLLFHETPNLVHMSITEYHMATSAYGFLRLPED